MQRGATAILILAGSMAIVPVRAADRFPPGAAACSGCHAAPQGEGAPVPLSDLSADAIATALATYRSGARSGTVMPRLAKGFTPEESRAIADALGRAQGAR